MLPKITAIDRADEDVRAKVVGPLAEANTRRDFAFSTHFLTFALIDEIGVEGGLLAQFYWDWLHIEVVAVPVRWRGLGLGRQLVERAEAAAIEAACIGVWVDTYSFQAPEFYEAIGYTPFGRLPNYPKGHERIFYQKILRPGPPDKPENAA